MKPFIFISGLFLLFVLLTFQSNYASATRTGCPCAPTRRKGGICYHFTNAQKDLPWLPPWYIGTCHAKTPCSTKFVCKSGSKTWCTKRTFVRVVTPIKNKQSFCKISLVKRNQLIPYTSTSPANDPRFRKPTSFHFFFAGDSHCWIFYRGKHIADCQNYKKVTVVKNIPLTQRCDPVHIQMLDGPGSGRGFIAAVDAGGHMVGSFSKHIKFSKTPTSGWTSWNFNPSRWSKGIKSSRLARIHQDLKSMTGAQAVTWGNPKPKQRIYIIVSLKKFCQAPYWS